jgi:hypothetical protein
MRQALLLDKQRAFKLHRPLGSDQREFEVHLIEGIFPICVASDDPCLTGIGTSSPGKDCSSFPTFRNSNPIIDATLSDANLNPRSSAQ